MSEQVILVLLAAVVLALLLLPLVRRRGGALPPAGSASIPRADMVDAGMVDEDPAALALREIELDREMGKLSEADYRTLRAKYEAVRPPRPAGPEAVPPDGPRVAAASPARQAHEGALTPEELGQRAESLVHRWRQRTVRCPDCGDRPEPDARYCSNCGRVVAPCSNCGSAINEYGARYCTRCGAAIAA